MSDLNPGPVSFDGLPGWRVPRQDGQRDVRLQPAVDAGWGSIRDGDGPPILLAASGSSAGIATAALPGTPDVRVDARRAASDWASLRRAGKARRVALLSALMVTAGMLGGISIGVVATLVVGRPMSVVGSAPAVILVFALAGIPFRRAQVMYTEYRLVIDGVATGSWLTWPADVGWRAQVAVGDGLESTGIAVVSDWASAAPAAQGRVTDVPAVLVATPVDRGLLGFWSGDLWLLPDELLFDAHDLRRTLTAWATPRPVVTTTRSFTVAEVDAVARRPHGERVRWADVVAGQLSQQGAWPTLRVRLASGRWRKFLLTKGLTPEAAAAVAVAGRAALGDRFVVTSVPARPS